MEKRTIMRIIRNTLAALSRYKLFTALNVLGLTIVLTVVYMLLIPVYNSLTWNSKKNKKKLFFCSYSESFFTFPCLRE